MDEISGLLKNHTLISDGVWYLSSNGADTRTCGRNVSTARKTLARFLNRYNNSHGMKNSLSLITDSVFVIDNHLKVSAKLPLPFTTKQNCEN